MVRNIPYLRQIAAAVVIIVTVVGFQHYGITGSHLGDGGIFSPGILSRKDKELYQTIFAAQKSGEWKKADTAIGRLSNPVLLSYVLSERYLSKDYKASADEVSDWLSLYEDHPKAYEIYSLATRKGLALKYVRKPQSLSGYGDDNGMAARFANSPQMATWNKGIKEWRNGNKLDAARTFAGMLSDKSLPPWKVSAAAFWSYRGYLSAGNSKEAQKYLNIAASEPRTFYGILARKKLGQNLELDSNPITLSSDDMDEIYASPALQRVIALSEIGRGELAEKELRIIFPDSSHKEKLRLLALAHDLGLASVQITMARQLGSDERSLDYARYPIPEWQPLNGFKIDRALLFALVRQESGFHAAAVSPSGASGLMQIMPQTASYMKKRMPAELVANDKDPMLNTAIGQNYVQHLLENELVEGNLLYMLTAYNAGPGRLAEWKNSISYNNDPLLFIESIPFAETRNYVMQVMTNYWIYSELAGNPNPSTFAVLSGEWPDYNKHSAPRSVGALEALLNAG